MSAFLRRRAHVRKAVYKSELARDYTRMEIEDALFLPQRGWVSPRVDASPTMRQLLHLIKFAVASSVDLER